MLHLMHLCYTSEGCYTFATLMNDMLHLMLPYRTLMKVATLSFIQSELSSVVLCAKSALLTPKKNINIILLIDKQFCFTECGEVRKVNCVDNNICYTLLHLLHLPLQYTLS